MACEGITVVSNGPVLKASRQLYLFTVHTHHKMETAYKGQHMTLLTILGKYVLHKTYIGKQQ